MRLSIQTGGGSQCAGAHLSRRGLQHSATPESACRRIAVAQATPPRSSARAPVRQDDADSLLEEFSLLDDLFGGAEPHASMADAGVEEDDSAYDEGQEDGQHPEASGSDSHSTAQESPVLPQRQALGRSAARPWERAVPQAQQPPAVTPAPPGPLQSRRNTGSGSKSSSSGMGAPVQPFKLARQTPRLTLKARPLESAVAPTEAVGAADPIVAGQRPSHPPAAAAAAAATASTSAAAEPDGLKLRPRPQLPTLMGKLKREPATGTASGADTRSGSDAPATSSRRQASGAREGGTAAGVGRGPGEVAQRQGRSEMAARGEEETAAAAAAAAAAWFAQDPVFQAAEAAAAAGRRSLPAEVDSLGTASSSGGSNDAWPSHPLERSSMTAGYSRVADLLEPLPLLELQPPTDMPPPWQAQPWLERPAATTDLSSSSSAPAPPSSLPGVATAAPLVTTSRGSSGAQFVPSTRVSRRKRVEPSASTQLQAALAREIAAVTKPPSQRQAERAAGPSRGAGSAGPAPLLMRQVTPETLPGGLSSGGQLPEVGELPAEVDAANWRLHARVRFPKVYDTAWHSSWYEFQSDLWTAVGKAHEALASGSERAPGALLTPGSAARAAQQQLLEDAYEFAELCWKSQDSRVKVGLALAVADTLVAFEAMFEECAAMLLPDLMAKGVLPLLRLMHPEDYGHFLSRVRQELGDSWPPSLVTPKPLSKLVARLRALKAVHPEVDLGVLAFLDEACNLV